MKVQVKRLRDVPLPEYHSQGAAGFDLAIFEDMTLWPGQMQLAWTGLVIATPEDHMLVITPRSSTFKRYKVSLGNTVGIVDSDFSGPDDELVLQVFRPTNHAFNAGLDDSFPITIPAGTRIAQGIIVPVVRAEFEEVQEMTAPTRGGWGSTGV
jgi:dUTP pyrophosphatase